MGSRDVEFVQDAVLVPSPYIPATSSHPATGARPSQSEEVLVRDMRALCMEG